MFSIIKWNHINLHLYFIYPTFTKSFKFKSSHIQIYLILNILLLILIYKFLLKEELYKKIQSKNKCHNILYKNISIYYIFDNISSKKLGSKYDHQLGSYSDAQPKFNQNLNVLNPEQVHLMDKIFCDKLKLLSDQIKKLDNYNKQYWNATLFYCSNLQFCSQMVDSKKPGQMLEAELAKPFLLNENVNVACDIQGHKVYSILNVSLKNVFYFNYHYDFKCLRNALSSDLLYDCPLEVTPCLVPNISHIVWYGRDRPLFRFHHYISMRSDLIMLRPHVLIIWFDEIPKGEWFSEILKFARDNVPNTKLFLVQRKDVEFIYNRPIKVSEHSSDIVRLEAVLQFGGFYHDLDVVILRSLSPLRRYMTTLGHEFEPVIKPKNGSNNNSFNLNLKQVHGLCNGVIIGAPQSYFLRMYHFEYRLFNDSNWGLHSVLLPAIISSVSSSEYIYIYICSIYWQTTVEQLCLARIAIFANILCTLY